jgi:hypothetical protein
VTPYGLHNCHVTPYGLHNCHVTPQGRLHGNGFMPTPVGRARLLHLYLCSQVGLSTPAHTDVPVLLSAHDRATLQQEQQQQQQQQLLLLALAPGRERSWLNAARERHDRWQAAGETSNMLTAFTAVTDGNAHGNSSSSGGGSDDAEGQGRAAGTAADSSSHGGGGGAVAAGGGAGGGAGGAAATGGRVLSMKRLWSNMPLAVALQVAGTTSELTNLVELLTTPAPPPTAAAAAGEAGSGGSGYDGGDVAAATRRLPPRMADLHPADIRHAFGPRSWQRLQKALVLLTRMGLVKPACRDGISGRGLGECALQKVRVCVVLILLAKQGFHMHAHLNLPAATVAQCLSVCLCWDRSPWANCSMYASLCCAVPFVPLLLPAWQQHVVYTGCVRRPHMCWCRRVAASSSSQ